MNGKRVGIWVVVCSLCFWLFGCQEAIRTGVTSGVTGGIAGAIEAAILDAADRGE